MQTNPINQNFEIPQKTSKAYEFIFSQSGSRVDITGWTIFFTMKNNMNDADTSAVLQKTVTSHTDALQGETLVELSASDTNLTPKTYYYDFKFKTDDGAIRILYCGKMTIMKIVTQRES